MILPSGIIHNLANLASDIANHISASLADKIVTNTRDYAENSSYLKRYLHKVEAIYPPVELEQAKQTDIKAFCEKADIQFVTL